MRDRFNSLVRKIPWSRAWQPTPVSCLENSIDRGAWRATVCRATKSQTQLKRLSTYIYTTSVLSLPPLPSTPPLQVIKEHQAGLPALYSNFLAAISLTHDSVYMTVLLSPIVPQSPSATMSQAHSLYLSLHSFPANRFDTISFTFHIYALLLLSHVSRV